MMRTIDLDCRQGQGRFGPGASALTNFAWAWLALLSALCAACLSEVYPVGTKCFYMCFARHLMLKYTRISGKHDRNA
ncbi:hypothetical protein QBC37DRAFT_409661 [Rhypophila decipiens]|uniref:Uncharacterized protein n=1 Tax=Rhypophila decipiens TaxID=261697 RepID=A0AAN7BDA7_9PEZI|nr:hypothetical protein QBC37DRAFT_409661 [Rhypophila decipiens]